MKLSPMGVSQDRETYPVTGRGLCESAMEAVHCKEQAEAFQRDNIYPVWFVVA